jgi:hypothetical protein
MLTVMMNVKRRWEWHWNFEERWALRIFGDSQGNDSVVSKLMAVLDGYNLYKIIVSEVNGIVHTIDIWIERNGSFCCRTCL